MSKIRLGKKRRGKSTKTLRTRSSGREREGTKRRRKNRGTWSYSRVIHRCRRQ
jgi:hypothetical protein